MATVVNPALPYTANLSGKFEIGTIIEVKGTVNADADRFAINLRTDKREVAFHFNPRFNDDVVVMNTKRDGSWETEERVPCCSLQRGQKFAIIILAESDKFMVSLNGEHYCHFEYRLKRKDIQILEVLGDAQVTLIREGTAFLTRSPIVNPTVPITVNIPGGFTTGRMLNVYGVATGNTFSINLQRGSDPFKNVALHFNPRLSQDAIILNDTVRGNWGGEEQLPIDLHEGWAFAIEIINHGDAYELRVNGRQLGSFAHRNLDIRPLHSIDFLHITGDVEIHQLRI